MRFASLSLALGFLLLPATAAAARAEESKPLRTLTYDVAYTLQTVRDSRVSGLTGGQPHDGTTTYATDVLCPVTYDGRFRVRAHLTPDTFAKKT